MAQRADAQRNRLRLLEVAAHAFAGDGPDVPLEKIAREAGVGIGTLYRHFPSREALIEAAYRNELSRLCDSPAELLAEQEPVAALRTWLGLFLDYMTAKRGMAEALRMVIASGGTPYAESKQRLGGAVTVLLGAAVDTGGLRGDVNPDDVLKTLSGIALVAGEPEDRSQAERMLDLLLDGLRLRLTIKE